MNQNSKKLKILLGLAIFLFVGIIFAAFAGYRFTAQKPITLISDVQSKANLSIEQFHYTAYRVGIKAWNIDARTAIQVGDGKKAAFELEDLFATYFTKSGGKVYLFAKHGILSMRSNNIEVFGDVLVKDETLGMKTEKLQYEHNRNIIHSKTPVTISGDSLYITGNSIVIDLETNRTVLKGDIKGTFSGNFVL
jgi:LPS export ABC transporter protein LptC